jgi:hypothetical protein
MNHACSGGFPPCGGWFNHPAEENDMHVQIVNFNLRDLSDGDYRKACDGLAPVLADVPGLISKVWLADEAVNTYGGIRATSRSLRAPPLSHRRWFRPPPD